ncbi:MAG: isocitrate/isopropylmalate dehydrogenase family protein [Planctomycetes bacterium]|nr:isocitrate/isopropylmalate dehydrogenase family protein [Planctomycetota bacterium]
MAHPAKHPVTLLLGDGTGPELARVARAVLDATGVAFEWDEVAAGAEALEREGTPLPPRVLESIRRTKTCLKAPITTPVGSMYRSVTATLRTEFDLYACVRRFKSYPGARSPFRNVDLVVFRENLEDLYAGIEFERGDKRTLELIAHLEQISGRKLRPDSGVAIKALSVFGSDRIVQAAYEYARAHGRKKLTVAHKADMQRHTDGLFLHTARNVAVRYPDVAFDQRSIDTLCMQLVQAPESFDVLVMPNVYGDLVGDLCAGLVGGLGLAPGMHVGDTGIAIFEATHGSAPKYKGLNRVNPCALILSGVMLLQHLGEARAAARLERAVAAVIREQKHVTYDLKPFRDDPTAVGTREMGQAIVRALETAQL